MDVTPIIAQDKKVIKTYGANGFTVSDDEYQHNIIIFPDSVHKWDAKDYDNLSPDAFEVITNNANKVEILLIGCGKDHQNIIIDIANFLRKHKIICEFMSTSAACRTYNVLLSEERKVAAALLAV